MDRRAVRRAALRAALAGAVAWLAGRSAGRRGLAGPAGAAAAAVGAAQEAPATFGPAAAMVAVVAARRHARGDRPAALAAAVTGGVAVAVATRGLWPVPPGAPAVVRSGRRVQVDPSPHGEGLVIAVNPNAGSSGDELCTELRDALPAARVVLLDEPGALSDVLDAAAHEPGTKALGVAGGDGSINAAAAVAHQHGLPLAIVPGGTLNHLARDLGVLGVADVAASVQAGTTMLVDLPCIDGRRFLNTASFGSYAELVDAREALEERVGKWPALAVALMRVLRRATPVEVELDGERRSLWMIFVGNCRYLPDGFAPTWREVLDDGVLDVRLVDAGHPFCRSRLVVALLTGQLGRSSVYDQWRSTQVVVRATDGPLRLACDGETFDGEADEVVIAKDGSRLALFAPAADEI